MRMIKLPKRVCSLKFSFAVCKPAGVEVYLVYSALHVSIRWCVSLYVFKGNEVFGIGSCVTEHHKDEGRL